VNRAFITGYYIGVHSFETAETCVFLNW